MKIDEDINDESNGLMKVAKWIFISGILILGFSLLVLSLE